MIISLLAPARSPSRVHLLMRVYARIPIVSNRIESNRDRDRDRIAERVTRYRGFRRIFPIHFLARVSPRCLKENTCVVRRIDQS